MTQPDLINRLRQLCEHAQANGADRVWLDETADLIVAAMLAVRLDPRRRRSHTVAASMAIALVAMREHGATHGDAVAALQRRYGKSRSRVYALLDLSRDFAGQKTD